MYFREELGILLKGRLFWILLAGSMAVNIWILANFTGQSPLVETSAQLKAEGTDYVTEENCDTLIRILKNAEPTNAQVSVNSIMKGTIWLSQMLSADDIAERDQEEVYGLTSSSVTEYNFMLLRFFSAFMMISAPVFVMPYMVAENRSRMPALQYSFTHGRKYHRRRLRAVIFATSGVLLAEICVYGLCAKVDRVFTLWDCRLSGFASGFIGWFPWTIGSYTICCLALSAMTAMGLSLISFVITSHLSNYVSAIAWQLPLTIFGGVFGGIAMYHFGEITRPRFLTAAVCAAVFAAGLLAAYIQGADERRKDA